MEDKVLYELKWLYNHNLNRYYNGCNYISTHLEQFDKYIPELLEIKDNLDYFLSEIKKYQELTDNDILNGFELKGEL